MVLMQQKGTYQPLESMQHVTLRLLTEGCSTPTTLSKPLYVRNDKDPCYDESEHGAVCDEPQCRPSCSLALISSGSDIDMDIDMDIDKY